MDGYQFTAAIVQSAVSLAWPVALVIVVLLFRRHLLGLLPLLRVKYKDLDFSFRLEQAEREAAALPKHPAEAETQPTPEEKSKFEKVAEVSPRAAILEARFEIDEAAKSLGQAAGFKGTTSILGLTRLLRSQEVIDPQTSALLDDLRVIGNNAAHNTDASFSFEDATRFRSLADRVIDQLRYAELQLRRSR